MKKGKNKQFGLLVSSLSEIFFKALLFIVNFFIAVGESTIKFTTIFLGLFLKSLDFLKKSVKKIKIPKIKLRKPGKLYLPKIRLRLKILTKEIFLKLRYLMLGSLLTLAIIFFQQSYLFVKSLPSPQNIGRVNYPLSTHIFDRNGKLLYEVYRDQNRTPVKIEELPNYVKLAAISIEDKDFYKHNGISFVNGILRAIKDSALVGNLQGGSTITQQLIKSSLLTSERTIERKIKEIILALWAEKIFTKDQILEMYLNQVPYGGSSYGIEEAAKTYFGKRAKDLTLSQAALLSGLPIAPTYYSPYIHPERAISRRNEVLDLMKTNGYINESQVNQAKAEELEFKPIETKIYAPHFVFYTKSELESIFGLEKVEEGGFKVATSLDLEIQNETEKILKEEIEKIRHLNVSNGAILVTRPSTGEILAMVGSVDYEAKPHGAFNVTTALRQPGSSIKPIMYSAALDRGFTTATIINDSPVTFDLGGGYKYKPVNYDNRYHGRVTLRLALANSYNIPAVKVLNEVGIENFVNQARRLGIRSWDDSSRFGLSLTLGGGEVMLVDMATAYGVLANQGYKIEVNPLVEVEDAYGNFVYEPSRAKAKVLNEGIAFIISDILSDNFSRQLAFGSRSLLEIPGSKVAVKTGTTDDKKDNLAIGYTPEFVVVVWVGNNDNTPMNPYLTSGVTGATPIWNRVMNYLLNNYGSGNKWYRKPENVVEKKCYFAKVEYFLKGTENKVSCKESLLKTTPTPKKD